MSESYQSNSTKVILFIFIVFFSCVVALMKLEQNSGPVLKGKILRVFFLPIVTRYCPRVKKNCPNSFLRGTNFNAYKIIMSYSYQVNNKTCIGYSTIVRCGSRQLLQTYKSGMPIDIVYNPKKVNDSHVLE